MLGFDVSERTISHRVRHAPRDPGPAKRWLAFLRNHRAAIAAMDFFTVPTQRFSIATTEFLCVADWLAERVGFEPTVGFPQHSLSRRALSTAQTPLREPF